jgi:hypothetical protein
MNRISLLATSIALILSTGLGVAATQKRELCEGFVPPNTMKIPVGWKAPIGWKSRVQFGKAASKVGGITEKQFNDVMDRMEKLYTDEIKQQGATLKINRNWTDDTVNASAEEIGKTWVLNMYGGLARHPEINLEGMALVVCHEMGHHRGGAPHYGDSYGSSDWGTNEGGADYYATLKCLRRYFAEDDNASILAQAQLDPFAVSQCKSQFTNDKDVQLCERSSMSGSSVRPQYNTPDKTEVGEMDDNHPATQCREDTYFAGATCHVDVSVPNSNTDYREGSCVQGVDTVGYRPRCWFKPSDTTAKPKPTPAPTGDNGDNGDNGNNGNGELF